MENSNAREMVDTTRRKQFLSPRILSVNNILASHVENKTSVCAEKSNEHLPLDLSEIDETGTIAESHFVNDSFESTESFTRKDDNEEAIRDREEAESEALARQLIASEAIASYSLHSSEFFRHNSENLSTEDMAALQVALQEENEDVFDANINVDGSRLEGFNDSEELSYESMLRLGECIGDVKLERWAVTARDEINKIPIFKFDKASIERKIPKDDTFLECLICQEKYEDGDNLRRLPLCGHVFHSGCVDCWLLQKDCCPYCRRRIINDVKT